MKKHMSPANKHICLSGGMGERGLSRNEIRHEHRQKHLSTWVIFRIFHICIREHDVLHYGNRKVATQQH
jgi:hypothetical protein